ncbi:MAG: hypothetical protein HOD63_16625 [Bacteroidetes bacterium]|jgi:hypothetical protein|nr:hypothetical protein [Bacteroidota bacterium]MBT5530881.1 hypothetical protein [Cytophagia bacterium]MBT3422639.1 hypothetical protein [Bacteroidota bacterium]MBT3802139.1 hypothetical protein [Bacteroidota bacterium]MBT3932834.1 hypothetical protein [Bacteroidota bacterium]
MIIYIGIDDTDNKESRGTGFKSRQLGELIEKEKIGRLKGITRHQLYVHDDIPYTSQNSSACIEVDAAEIDKVIQISEDFLKREAEIGSDAGLCVVKPSQLTKEHRKFGLAAKREVLSQDKVKAQIEGQDIFLEGYTGTKDGIIGAFAAVALRSTGNDGRFVWLQGLRNLRSGIYSSWELSRMIDIDNIANFEGVVAEDADYIFVGDWVRPVLKNHKKTLLVEEVSNYGKYQWETVSKHFIRSVS